MASITHRPCWLFGAEETNNKRAGDGRPVNNVTIHSTWIGSVRRWAVPQLGWAWPFSASPHRDAPACSG